MSEPTPLPYPARVILAGRVIAESRGAIRVDRHGEAPELWLPRADVGADVLDASPEAWRTGTDELAGHVSFDPDAHDVRVELVQEAGGDETTIRFPNWGDAGDMVDLLAMAPDGEHRYVSSPRSDWNRPVVEGSQLLGQALTLASRRAGGRRVVSASMIFARPVDDRVPYELELDEVANGRTFTAVRSAVTQGGRTCAFGTLLLDATADDLIRHSDPAPGVPGPHDSTHVDMSVTGRDIRVVDDAYTNDPDAPVGPPEIAAWVRFPDVDADQPAHAGLLAQFTGHMSIAAAMRPHAGIGQAAAHRTLSTAINEISLSIHADIRADHWMLYHHRSTFAGAGMTHSECRVYDEDRQLVASFTVEAMVRGFGDPAHSVDHRTSL